MTGETNLSTLLATLAPRLNEGEYVFCTVDDIGSVPPAEIIGSFREEEGMSVIVRKELADDLGLDYDSPAAWITLTVHSSLDAVGLTAAFSKALSEKGIPCNIVAGFYHDHIFVPKEDAEKALDTLRRLSVNF